jgi:hypothetical protein
VSAERVSRRSRGEVVVARGGGGGGGGGAYVVPSEALRTEANSVSLRLTLGMTAGAGDTDAEAAGARK